MPVSDLDYVGIIHHPNSVSSRKYFNYCLILQQFTDAAVEKIKGNLWIKMWKTTQAFQAVNLRKTNKLSGIEKPVEKKVWQPGKTFFDDDLQMLGRETSPIQRATESSKRQRGGTEFDRNPFQGFSVLKTKEAVRRQPLN